MDAQIPGEQGSVRASRPSYRSDGTTLLQRIDPDGTLLDHVATRDSHTVPMGSLWHRPTRNALESTLVELRHRGLLRDPDEPTLAEVREKVEAMIEASCETERKHAVPGLRFLYENDRVTLRAILTLLEPRKPERYEPGSWVVHRLFQASLVARDEGEYLLLVIGCEVKPVLRSLCRPATPDEIACARGTV